MSESPQRKGAALMALGALGVVYGDIGTSPLYAYKAMLHDVHKIDQTTVYGLTSTVVWTLTAIVSVLYVGTLTKMDHHGQGGLLALLTLVRRQAKGRVLAVATVIGMMGAALFLGDSLVTPAISVLSASEGMKVADSGLAWIAVPGAVVILFGVFVLQHVGSGKIGKLYGPVMLLWFVLIAGVGVGALVQHPQALEALSPTWAILYFRQDPTMAFLSLGSVVLTITGAEALYADLGHFDRKAVVRSWFALVYPALIIAYLGEAAAVNASPAKASEPFFAVIPSWGTPVVVVIATLATIIASEATIAGAFTVLHQASGLGMLPLLRTRHPSEEGGQVYIPGANWAMCAAVLAIVLGFGSSQALASAYGVAVSGTIVTTVLLAALHTRLRREHRRFAVIVVLGAVAVLFVFATTTKILSGGWLPLAVALVLFTILTTWRSGRQLLRAQRRRSERSTADFVEGATDVAKREGSAVFLTDESDTIPLALAFLLEQERQLPRTSVILSWRVEDQPDSPPHEESLRVHELTPGLVRVETVLGFRDRLDPEAVIGRAIERAPDVLADLDPATTLYFASDERPLTSRHSPMRRWQQRLFITLKRLSRDRTDQLRLPLDRTVVLVRDYPLE